MRANPPSPFKTKVETTAFRSQQPEAVWTLHAPGKHWVELRCLASEPFHMRMIGATLRERHHHVHEP